MSGKSYKWHGSIIRLGEGFAADSPPKAITAITKANPAVVSIAAHGLEPGDIVQFSGIVGMEDLNGGAYIVASVPTAGSIALLGVDTTDYPAYVSGGTLAVMTYGSNFCELTSYARNGAAAPTIDTTSLCSTFQESDLGLPGFGSVDLGYKFAPGTAAQQRLFALEASGEYTGLLVTLPNNGGTRVHAGRVSVTNEQSSNGNIWTGSATMQLSGQSFDVETA